MKLFILYNVRDTQPQYYNDGTGMRAIILLVTESELEALRFKKVTRCEMTVYEYSLKWISAGVKEFLEKRRNKIKKDTMLFSSYEHVIQDLISNTDPCTGELYSD